MQTSLRGYASFAACAGALAVVMGAFGAHALKGEIDIRSMQVWQTAVEYQFWHALALLATAAFANGPEIRWWRYSARCFAAGVPVFCGSLYALALGAPRAVGAITPFGGLLFVAGWVLLAIACRSHEREY